MFCFLVLWKYLYKIKIILMSIFVEITIEISRSYGFFIERLLTDFILIVVIRSFQMFISPLCHDGNLHFSDFVYFTELLNYLHKIVYTFLHFFLFAAFAIKSLLFNFWYRFIYALYLYLRTLLPFQQATHQASFIAYVLCNSEA